LHATSSTDGRFTSRFRSTPAASAAVCISWKTSRNRAYDAAASGTLDDDEVLTDVDGCIEGLIDGTDFAAGLADDEEDELALAGA
jgi:hypothetical protein